MSIFYFICTQMHFIKHSKEKGALQTLVGWELVTESSFCIASPAGQFVMPNIISSSACLPPQLGVPLSRCPRWSMALRSTPARRWI